MHLYACIIVLDGYWGLLEDATHLIIFIGLKKLKLLIVAPSRVRSSPHNLSVAPLPTDRPLSVVLQPYRWCVTSIIKVVNKLLIKEPVTRYLGPSRLPTVGSGAAEKLCGLERTREGETMGNFN